jgi:uncharacterized protein YjbJ (UPF0337 family)
MPPASAVFPATGRFIPFFEENTMNKDRMEGNWRQFKGKVKEQWGKLTDDDLDVIAGKRTNCSARSRSATASARKKPKSRLPCLEGPQPDRLLRALLSRLLSSATTLSTQIHTIQKGANHENQTADADRRDVLRFCRQRHGSDQGRVQSPE